MASLATNDSLLPERCDSGGAFIQSTIDRFQLRTQQPALWTSAGAIPTITAPQRYVNDARNLRPPPADGTAGQWSAVSLEQRLQTDEERSWMETVQQTKASIEDPQRTRKGRGFSDPRREHDEDDIDPEYCRDLGAKLRHAARWSLRVHV